jgi:hypothetical protein
LKNRKYRNVRKCVFEKNNLPNFISPKNNVLRSKKETLKYLESNLNESVATYNTVYNNILVENLIRNYPNYLKDFKKRLKEDYSR